MLCTSQFVFSHQGLLDSDGGHFIRSTGVYHSHSVSDHWKICLVFPLVLFLFYVIFIIVEKLKNKK